MSLPKEVQSIGIYVEKFDEDDLLREARMMRDAQENPYDKVIEFGQQQIKDFQKETMKDTKRGDSK